MEPGSEPSHGEAGKPFLYYYGKGGFDDAFPNAIELFTGPGLFHELIALTVYGEEVKEIKDDFSFYIF